MRKALCKCYRQDHCACVERLRKNIHFKLVPWQMYGSCSVLLHRTQSISLDPVVPQRAL